MGDTLAMYTRISGNSYPPQDLYPPTPMKIAIEQVEAWMESPTLVLLTETNEHWKTLRDFLIKGKISGAQVHDPRVASLCKQHGITELWTADRDFSRYKGIKTRNPLI